MSSTCGATTKNKAVQRQDKHDCAQYERTSHPARVHGEFRVHADGEGHLQNALILFLDN